MPTESAPVRVIRGYGSAGEFAAASANKMYRFGLQSDGNYAFIQATDVNKDSICHVLIPFYQFILGATPDANTLRIFDLSNSMDRIINTNSPDGSKSLAGVRSGNGDAMYIVGTNQKLNRYNFRAQLLGQSIAFGSTVNTVIIHRSSVVMGLENGKIVFFPDGQPAVALASNGAGN